MTFLAVAVPALIVWFAMAALTGFIAHAKSRSFGLWFLLGLIMWPLAILLAAFMPRRLGTAAKLDARRLPCPACGEPVLPEAAICPHCRTDLLAQRPARLAADRRRVTAGRWRTGVLAAAAFAGLAWLVLFL